MKANETVGKTMRKTWLVKKTRRRIFMKKQKRISKLCLVALFVMVVCIKTNVYAIDEETFQSKVSVEDEQKIKLSWKKQKVKQYKIYRADVKVTKDGVWKVGKYRLLKTLSGKKKSFTDKSVEADNRYSYMIEVYKKKNGKLKCVYKEQDIWAYSGLETPQWDEYAFSDTKTSCDGIPLEYAVRSDSVRPQGIVFYKKVDGKFKKIKSFRVKKKKDVYQFTDTDVQMGKGYTYKIRTYYKKNGKKVFSDYSDSLKLYAINYEASCNVQVCTPYEEMTDELVFALTNGDGNSAIKLGTSIDTTYFYSSDTTDGNYIFLELEAYSYDNHSWMTEELTTLKLKQNKTIYLKFKTTDGSKFYFGTNQAKKSVFQMEVQYSKFNYLLNVDFVSGTAGAYKNMEFYH